MSMPKMMKLKLFVKNKFNDFLNANTDPSIAVNRFQTFITQTVQLFKCSCSETLCRKMTDYGQNLIPLPA